MQRKWKLKKKNCFTFPINEIGRKFLYHFTLAFVLFRRTCCSIKFPPEDQKTVFFLSFRCLWRELFFPSRRNAGFVREGICSIQSEEIKYERVSLLFGRPILQKDQNSCHILHPLLWIFLPRVECKGLNFWDPPIF